MNPRWHTVPPAPCVPPRDPEVVTLAGTQDTLLHRQRGFQAPWALGGHLSRKSQTAGHLFLVGGGPASAPPHVQCVAEVGYSTWAEHIPFANCHRRRIVNVMGRLGDRKIVVGQWQLGIGLGWGACWPVLIRVCRVPSPTPAWSGGPLRGLSVGGPDGPGR